MTYEVNWLRFRKGFSFFIPCIDHAAARMDLDKVARRLDLQVVTKVTIEDGIKGLRVWRL